MDAVRASKRKRERGEEFDTLDKIAMDFHVTRQTLHAWVRASDAAGGTPPPPGRPGRPPRWAGEGATIVRDLHRHLLNAAPEQRTTEELIDWFAARGRVRYAAATLPRMLWRLGCTFAASGSIGGVWTGQQALAASVAPATAEPAAPPTSLPDWLTDGRRRRIIELVRKGVDPRHQGPVTSEVVMQQLPTMATAMQTVGATEADLLTVLPLVGVKVEPVSGVLRIVEAPDGG